MNNIIPRSPITNNRRLSLMKKTVKNIIVQESPYYTNQRVLTITHNSWLE